MRGAVRAIALGGGLLVSVARLPAPLAAQSNRGLAVLETAAERYHQVDTLCADFTQRLQVPLLDEDRTGTGRMCQARPDLFAMRFSDPEGDAVVMDGTSTWLYYPSVDPKQVIQIPMAMERGGHDFHREFLDEPESKYDVTFEAEDRVDGVPTYRLRLVPKGTASYRVAVLWIDQGKPVLRQIRLEEENETVRTITLSHVDFEAHPAAGWFTFTPPKGASVIPG